MADVLRSTRDVSELLGISVASLSRAVWERRLKEPQRGPGGAFLWRQQDMERASWLLCHKPLETVLAERGGKGGAE